MPNWNEILDEIKEGGSIFDVVRRKYLGQLHELTGRNVIIYYSGFLQSPDGQGNFAINDLDKIGFMSACNKVDATKGLDLLLHTPGGAIAATESLIDYLHKVFSDIRVVVPQLAMSGGTMIACSARSILMGKQSSLGPIDPQLGGLPAHGILEEFQKAFEQIQQSPAYIPIWQPIIAKYPPTVIGECQKAIQWAEEVAKYWLVRVMFAGEPDAEQKADAIVHELGSHAITKSHERHLSAERCQEIGLKVERLEGWQELQDAVLSVHHACMHTMAETGAQKIIENHQGAAYISTVKQFLVRTN